MCLLILLFSFFSSLNKDIYDFHHFLIKKERDDKLTNVKWVVKNQKKIDILKDWHQHNMMVSWLYNKIEIFWVNQIGKLKSNHLYMKTYAFYYRNQFEINKDSCFTFQMTYFFGFIFKYHFLLLPIRNDRRKNWKNYKLFWLKSNK